MPSPLPTFKTGDPADKALNSTFLNGIVERLGLTANEQTRKSVDGIPSLSTVTALVTNRTGSAIAAGSVVAVSDIELTIGDAGEAIDFQSGPVFSVDVPSRTDDMPAIALEPIEDGESGRVAIGGIAVCLTTEPGVGERSARPVPGDTSYLEPSSSGPARIWHRNSGSGLQWTVVYLCCGDGVDDGSGSGSGSGDLTSIVIGPYLTDVTEPECYTDSGGTPRIRFTKTWGITTVTGVDLSVTQSVYEP